MLGIINQVNCLCKQEAVEKGLNLPICHADRRTAKYCVVLVTTVKTARRESK
jgi:hypothetical protein